MQKKFVFQIVALVRKTNALVALKTQKIFSLENSIKNSCEMWTGFKAIRMFWHQVPINVHLQIKNHLQMNLQG